MTELEKKLLLTENEYDYLMERLDHESPSIQKSIITQINFFFIAICDKADVHSVKYSGSTDNFQTNS